MIDFSFVQVIGYIAFCASVLRFQMKTSRQIRFVNLIASFLFAVHYCLLGTMAGAALSFLAGCRSSVLLNQIIWRYKRHVAFVVLGIAGFTTFLIYEDFYDVFPFLGVFFGTMMDMQSKAIYSRFFGAIMASSWFVFNFFVGSYGGLLSSTFNLLSNLIGFGRHQLIPYLKTKDKSYFDI